MAASIFNKNTLERIIGVHIRKKISIAGGTGFGSGSSQGLRAGTDSESGLESYLFQKDANAFDAVGAQGNNESGSLGTEDWTPEVLLYVLGQVAKQVQQQWHN